MRKWLYAAVGAILVSAVLPALGAFAVEVAKAAGWVTAASGAMSSFANWLVWFVGSQSYLTLVVAALALAAGVGLDWLARGSDAARAKFYVDLSARLQAERDRLVDVRNLYLEEQPIGETNWLRQMTLAYLDQMALQKTLQDRGFKVPWLNWTVHDDPEAYLKLMTGYFGVLMPLLREGHTKSAKDASHRVVDWDSGRGPMFLYGGAMQPLWR